MAGHPERPVTAMLLGVVVALAALAYVLYPLVKEERITGVTPRGAGGAASAHAKPACSTCGARPELDAVFCSSCGRPLSAGPDRTGIDSPPAG